MKLRIILFTALILLLALPVRAIALDFDPNCVDLEWSEAPEGTVYMDLLIRLPEDDENYASFTHPPRYYVERYLDENGTTQNRYEPMPIGPDSEIAGYSEDGYVSLSLHFKAFQDLIVYNSSHNKDGSYSEEPPRLWLARDSGITFEEGLSKYGELKAAYVDGEGNVLGVTKTAKTSYNASEPYAYIAKGDKLTFRIFGWGPLDNAAVFLTIAALIVLLCLAGFLFVRFVTRMFRHPGELADELDDVMKDGRT